MAKIVRMIYFEITSGQHETIEKALAAGGYDHGTPVINNQNFPVINRDKKVKKIVILEFDSPVESEEALAEGKKKELMRPDYQDALDFGEQHPDEQRNGPIVFLHKGAKDNNKVIVLFSFAGFRCITTHRFRTKRTSEHRFVFIQE